MPASPDRSASLSILLQCALRITLVVFIAITLLLEPPDAREWMCVLVLLGYVVAVTMWCVAALRPASRSAMGGRRTLSLLMLGTDLAVVAALSALTGVVSPDSWTSDVLRTGLFLIPLIAAAQLDPYVSGAIVVPTLTTYLVVAWINQQANAEPWGSILLTFLILAALAGGSGAVSYLQRARLTAIDELAGQRSTLLEELVTLEKQERQTLSERLHDGALQYVIVARQDLEDVRAGSADATDRADSALGEATALLRNVVRELHPAVLSAAGLSDAPGALAEGIGERSRPTVHFDAGSWPESGSTGADYLLYSAAREAVTNALKHAGAENLWIELGRAGDDAWVRVSDDGVGISPDAVAHSVENGHIGMASMRAKVQAAGGAFTARPTDPGTEVEICLPVGTVTP